MRYLVFSVVLFGLGLGLFLGGCSSSQQGVHRTTEWRGPVEYGPQPGTQGSVDGRHPSAEWEGGPVVEDGETPWRLLRGKRDRDEVRRYVVAVVTYEGALAQHTDNGRARGTNPAIRRHLAQLMREVREADRALQRRQRDIRRAAEQGIAGALLYGERHITGQDVINSLVEFELSQNAQTATRKP